MHNCDLVNLEDMLQNGTVISETLIERPHSFSTACNIATQIIAQVASNQYGGQSISLAHLAPFVQVSRVKIRQEVIGEMKDLGIAVTEDQIDKLTEERLRRDHEGNPDDPVSGRNTPHHKRTGTVRYRLHVPRRGEESAGEKRPCDDHRGDLKTEISRR